MHGQQYIIKEKLYNSYCFRIGCDFVLFGTWRAAFWEEYSASVFSLEITSVWRRKQYISAFVPTLLLKKETAECHNPQNYKQDRKPLWTSQT